MPTIWLNGQFQDESAATISPRDTGLLHAAGVFTTMRSYAGKVFRLPHHLARLRDSCAAMSIPFSPTDPQIQSAVTTLLEQNNLSDARLRLTITRGKAGQDGSMEPTVLLTATDLTPYPADYYHKGVTAAVEDQFKLNPYDPQAGHKTLNYFSRLHSLRSANQRGAGESLLFDVHNYLQSGSISNIFIVKDAKLLTPLTQPELTATPTAAPYPRSSVLPGITRAAVIELAQQLNIPTTPSAIDINALLAADEVFVTNSIMGVMPVCRIERKAVGNDRPGDVTVKLMGAYASLMEKEQQA